MSVTATKYAFEAIQKNGPVMTLAASLVLLALAHRHHQETGRCDPSLATLCDMTTLSERGVRKGLRQLEMLKIITTEHRMIRTGQGRRNLRNRYTLRCLSSGAPRAGGVGHHVPGIGKIYARPSAFTDLAMSIEIEADECPPIESRNRKESR